MEWNKLLAREGVDLVTISGIDIVFYGHIWEFMKKKEESFFTLLDGKNFTHFIGVDAQELGRYLYRKHFNSPEQVKKYYEDGKKLLQHIKETTTKWKKALESDKTKLLEAFNDFKKQFMEINYIYSITSWLAIEAWQADYEKMVSASIRKNDVMDQHEQILGVVYAPWKKTAVYEVQDKIRQGVPPEKIVQDYQFLRSWCVVWHRPIDRSWVESIGKGAEVAEEAFSREQVISLLKPDEEEKHFFEMAPYIIFFKDWRDDLRRSHAYYWTFLFEHFAEKFTIDYNDVGRLTLDEIEDCIKNNKVDKDMLETRRTKPLIATVVGEEIKITVFDDGIPEKYTGIINEIEEKEKQLSIKGLVAQKGKAQGRVIILRSYHDIKKVKEGDILVANTTHPNYLPAMQKAAAFVTNEGGIASHAAIVSRELKKPCIVGTKVATKVLKEQDFVEVDADKGIVRIIR